MSVEALLDLRAVGVCIDGVDVLREITFAVSEGERVAVIGPNGCGKSTLLKAITGFTPLSRGELTFAGRRIDTGLSREGLRQHRRELGVIHQGLHLVGRLSVMENILIGRLGRNVSPKTWLRRFNAEDYEVARNYAERVGVAHKLDQRTDSLSGGERQRVGIARALSQESRLILADEPTSALDPRSSKSIAQLMSELAEEFHLTIMTVIHDIALVPVLSERVIGIAQGGVAFDRATTSLDTSMTEELYE